MGFVPKVPRVGRGAGGDVERVLGLIKADLVFPLLIIHARRRVSAAVHGDVEVPAFFGLGTEGFFFESQGVCTDGDRLVLPLLLALFTDELEVVVPKKRSRLLGLGLGERR